MTTVTGKCWITFALQRFTAIEDLGRKYALSEKHNPRYYGALLTENPVWREFYYPVPGNLSNPADSAPN
jgi:hypothetical protein